MVLIDRFFIGAAKQRGGSIFKHTPGLVTRYRSFHLGKHIVMLLSLLGNFRLHVSHVLCKMGHFLVPNLKQALGNREDFFEGGNLQGGAERADAHAQRGTRPTDSKTAIRGQPITSTNTPLCAMTKYARQKIAHFQITIPKDSYIFKF